MYDRLAKINKGRLSFLVKVEPACKEMLRICDSTRLNEAVQDNLVHYRITRYKETCLKDYSFTINRSLTSRKLQVF
jgi:hypothetical protein